MKSLAEFLQWIELHYPNIRLEFMEEEEWFVKYANLIILTENFVRNVYIVISRWRTRNSSNSRRSVKKNEYSLLSVWTLLAMGLLMLVSCTCRICRSEYQSLLEATACCKEAKALDRRKTTDSILITGVKFKTHQLQFGLRKLGFWCRYGHCDLLSETCNCKKFWFSYFKLPR